MLPFFVVTTPEHEIRPGVADIPGSLRERKLIFPFLAGIDDSSVVCLHPSG